MDRPSPGFIVGIVVMFFSAIGAGVYLITQGNATTGGRKRRK